MLVCGGKVYTMVNSDMDIGPCMVTLGRVWVPVKER